ncbi:unnamed protein product [Periconia digitata]|uniref:RBR-type E3 ubiquitin transferase n=1 Tax=Periconia digitata TaxID=1303443 RepID=A0A9W4UTK4_9PLEO|nr:unnamed protein product [Periconia digitata]
MAIHDAVPAVPSPMMDEELNALALQLEEAKLFAQSTMNSLSTEDHPDYYVAHTVYLAELQRQHANLTDKRLACSIGVAVHSDGDSVLNLASQEVLSRADRHLAVDFVQTNAGFENAPSLDQRAEAKIQDWVDTAGHSQNLGILAERSHGDHAAHEPSSYHSLGSIVTLSCGDTYCTGCLKELFVLATKDETLFPVQCHKELIPLDIVSEYLSKDKLEAFTRASVEFKTIDRVYCSNRECGRFILPSQLDAESRKATCDKCGAQTCISCKNKFHESNCEEDVAIKQVQEMAAGLGWKTCYSCKTLVSIRSGCNHMKCRCKAEFCYECGVQWKNCKCAHANIARIEARAEEIVARNPPRGLGQLELQREVRAVRDRLIQNHEWSMTDGWIELKLVVRREDFAVSCAMLNTRGSLFVVSIAIRTFARVAAVIVCDGWRMLPSWNLSYELPTQNSGR